MSRALDLAWRGWGRVQPNPLVGRGGAAEANWWARAGTPSSAEQHAEAVALAAAGGRARGATLVVTLEPCCAPGQAASMHRRDHPRAAYAGSSRRCRIPTRSPPAAPTGCAPPASRSSGSPGRRGVRPERHLPASASRTADRPFVALKLATTLDGRIADRARTLALDLGRPGAGITCTGSGRDSTPSPSAGAPRGWTTRRSRCGDRSSRAAAERVVFDRGRRISAVSSRWCGPPREIPTVVVVAPGDSARVRRLEAAGVDVIVRHAPGGDGDTPAQSGIGSLLVEGGGQLAGALLAAGLVDRYYWIQSPLWLGDGGRAGDRGAARPRRWTRRRSLAGGRAAGPRRGYAAGAGSELMFTGIVTAVGTVRRGRPARTGSS